MKHTYLSTLTQSRQAKLILPLAVVDGLFFASTDPSQGHLVLLAAGSILLLVTLYAVSWWLAHTLARIRLVPKERQRLVAVLIGGVMAYVLFMQSIGEFNMRDLFAIVPLAAILYFYLTYSRKVPDTR